MIAKNRLIIALDVSSIQQARALVQITKPFAQTYKIGLELFTAFGPKIVEEIQKEQVDIFLDLKLHDIPNTVAAAVKNITLLGVKFLTIHALGGSAMMAAAQAAADGNVNLLAVSILTSLDDSALHQIGIPSTTEKAVNDLTKLAAQAGLFGCVCSALEANQVKRENPMLYTVCPGIRPAGTSKQDQSRVMTPAEAIYNGADYIVVGRPITNAKDPALVAKSIVESMS